MRLPALMFVVSLGLISPLTGSCLAEEPSYLSCTFDSPDDNVTLGSIRVFGFFSKQFYGPKADRVYVEITKVGSIVPSYFSSTVMTSDGAIPKTKVTFDTDANDLSLRPIIPEAGTWVITVKAQVSNGQGGWTTLKTGSKTVVAQ